MKNAIILYGMGDTKESYWHPYLRKELEKRGYIVWIPLLPFNDNPSIETQLPFVLKNGVFNENTIIIGHSSGASLILAILEAIKSPIKKSILVSAFIQRGGVRPKKLSKKSMNITGKQ